MMSGGVLSILAVVLSSWPLSSEKGDSLIRNSIRLSMLWYMAALLTKLRLDRTDWNASTNGGKIARWFWTWALFCYIVHVAFAFHYFHHWSHTHAFEHTRQVGGFGAGIYLSYLFTGIWASDVVWWWLRPSTYANRSEMIGQGLHLFMLFMIFNGTVVFVTGTSRWFGILMFVVLSIGWFHSLIRKNSIYHE
jgi:hypothetical protein